MEFSATDPTESRPNRKKTRRQIIIGLWRIWDSGKMDDSLREARTSKKQKKNAKKRFLMKKSTGGGYTYFISRGGGRAAKPCTAMQIATKVWLVMDAVGKVRRLWTWDPESESASMSLHTCRTRGPLFSIFENVRLADPAKNVDSSTRQPSQTLFSAFPFLGNTTRFAMIQTLI